MKKLNLKLVALVLCLLISTLIFPKNSLALSTPSTPTNLTATVASSNQIYLTWNPVSSATYYYVYRATTTSGTYTNIASITTANYTDSSLSLNTTYCYKVLAVNSAGTSSDSSIVYATTTNSSGVPSTPTNLIATVASINQINLTWDPISSATYYYVYRSTSPYGTYSIVAVPTTTNYTDPNLSINTTYYYKVQAVGSVGTSSDSSIVYATTIVSNGALSAPTNLIATVASSNQIYLIWDPASYTTYYDVYRSTSPNGTYTIIAVPTTPNYTDSNLSLNTTYYYKVQAVNSSGSSSFSSTVYATTANSNGALPAPTTLTTTVANSNQMYLTWNPVSSAAYYYVYRATSPSNAYTNIATITTTNYTDFNLSQNTTYYYKVQAVNSSGLSSFSSIAYATTANTDNTAPPDAPPDASSQIQSDRLAGEDMYETSAEVAESGWKTSYYAFIVSGENFSDALCSAPLAQKYNAPLLLTPKDTLNEQTKTQLLRLKVKNVIIIGGSGVVSSVVEQSIKSMGIEVSRIAGNDRYETSIKIAQSMGQFNQAIIASGDTFPDALSIAPIAAMKRIPILLTPKDSLPQSVRAYLLKNVQSTYVVGGTGVVSENVLKQLPSPKRLSGINRYETNISIIKEFADELDFNLCYISTGEYYADALAGSTLASLTNSPVILVSNPVDQSTIDFFRDKTSSIKKEIVFGGTVVVPESVLISLNGTTVGTDTPSTPAGVSATTVSSSQINLTWESVSGATSYYVYGATSSSGTYTHIATVTTTSYANTGLWADTTYYYKVQAVNSAGSSSDSPLAYAKTT
ncbi:cell wall-binding repeat-containing protein [Desulfosporosinus sp. Sb-LF]|uniref:cell wall-binding repeat-containing protein n=1 Tax=Desulfosporosinus sp. Sb-LF TaxID=2560027 RepID=UPI00107F1049|nr:cell wall-binding repeat-containing protein [Desulfosporosinus sp. Sb-LF]TGE31863.1 cell wall-binding protein [Desulfosporosinus sp. Sb-LF]